MRIKLSDYEEHSIKIKDVYEPDEFFQFVERMNILAKMVRRDFLVDMNQSELDENQEEEKVKRHYNKEERDLPREKDGKFRCNRCQKYLDKDKFNKNASDRLGIQSTCRECGKNFQKSLRGTLNNDSKSKLGRPVQKRYGDTKEKVLRLLKVHYFGTIKEKSQLESETGLKWIELQKAFGKLRDRWKIQPKEIGLKFWPNIRGLHKQVAVEQARIK